MGVISLLICLFLFLIELFFFKKNLKNPITFFYLLWTIILFLSNLNLYSMKFPSDEAFSLIALMNIFLFVGDLIGNNKLLKNKKSAKINKYILIKNVFNIIFIFLLVFTLIDVFIIIDNFFKGVPLYDMRRWRMGTFGVDSNPILNRRTFIEETIRSVILSPFENIIFPISAYMFFNSNNKSEKNKFVLKSVLILILSSIAGGGGRLSYIYFFGCYLLGFLFMNKHDNIEQYNKYKKYIRFFLLSGFIIVFIITGLRTSNSFIGQTYKYFAMSPTLLSEWLPIIKDYNHTYGLLSFFGMHSYVFRFFEKVGFVSLVPNLYNDSFKYLLLAENFKNIGYGIGNAFVSPIYYFYIDGGIPFICIASIFFGVIITKFYNNYIKNINIRSFSLYCLIMYAVFISFIRIQTTMPNYILSIIMVYIITKKEVVNNE